MSKTKGIWRRRVEAKKQRLAAEKKWAKELTAAGWTETGKGWRQGRKASVSIEEALKESRQQKKQARLDEAAAIPTYLTEHGWTQSGPNGEVWSKPHWVESDWKGRKLEGSCFKTLLQAYKLERKLS